MATNKDYKREPHATCHRKGSGEAGGRGLPLEAAAESTCYLCQVKTPGAQIPSMVVYSHWGTRVTWIKLLLSPSCRLSRVVFQGASEESGKTTSFLVI